MIESRIGEWIDPYTVETFDHESKIVLLGRSQIPRPRKRFNSAHVKPFRMPIEASSSSTDILYNSFSVHATRNTRDPSEPPNILGSSAGITHDIHGKEIIDKNDSRLVS